MHTNRFVCLFGPDDDASVDSNSNSVVVMEPAGEVGVAWLPPPCNDHDNVDDNDDSMPAIPNIIVPTNAESKQ